MHITYAQTRKKDVSNCFFSIIYIIFGKRVCSCTYFCMVERKTERYWWHQTNSIWIQFNSVQFNAFSIIDGFEHNYTLHRVVVADGSGSNMKRTKWEIQWNMWDCGNMGESRPNRKSVRERSVNKFNCLNCYSVHCGTIKKREKKMTNNNIEFYVPIENWNDCFSTVCALLMCVCESHWVNSSISIWIFAVHATFVCGSLLTEKYIYIVVLWKIDNLQAFCNIETHQICSLVQPAVCFNIWTIATTLICSKVFNMMCSVHWRCQLFAVKFPMDWIVCRQLVI